MVSTRGKPSPRGRSPSPKPPKPEQAKPKRGKAKATPKKATPKKPRSKSPAAAPSVPKYTIILPVYNEASNLPIITHLIHSTFSKPPLSPADVRVLVVEDNSPDGTREVARQLRESYGPQFIQVLERSGKLGLGTA
jgi:dolichol-phosphate mannosyltransferase